MDVLSFDTPLGPMALEGGENGLERLYLPGQPIPGTAGRETPLLLRGKEELLEYLRRERREFSLPLSPRGTAFQLRVWGELERIPWGRTRTYGEIARAVDCPKGFRAVGMANHKNPLPILIPCHRVVGAGGALTGYAGGLELKRALLELEGVNFTEK